MKAGASDVVKDDSGQPLLSYLVLREKMVLSFLLSQIPFDLWRFFFIYFLLVDTGAYLNVPYKQPRHAYNAALFKLDPGYDVRWVFRVHRYECDTV